MFVWEHRSSTCLLGTLGVRTTSPSSSSKPLKVVIEVFAIQLKLSPGFKRDFWLIASDKLPTW